MVTLAEKIGRVSANLESLTKAKEFASLARCVALSRGHYGMASQLAEDARLPRIKSILEGNKIYELKPDEIARTKAAVLAGGTAVGDWSEQLASYQVLANAFLESLRNYGAFDRMLPAMRQVPFRTRVGASTTAITGTISPQSQIKPISRLTLSGAQIDEQKAVAILVVTNELATFGDAVAGNLFATELSNAVAIATDAEFIAQITSGATSFASTGSTAEGVRSDLRILLASITTSSRSRLFLLVTPAIAKTMSVLHTTAGDAAFPTMTYSGGQIGGIEVIASDGVTSGQMVLADAQQLAAASETVQLSATAEAVVAMDTAPDSPAAAGTVMTSLWQNNLTGLKAERFFGVEKLTTTGVAVVTGVAPTGDSPGP